MNTLLRYDLIRAQWNPLKDREELERRLSTMFGIREATGHGERKP